MGKYGRQIKAQKNQNIQRVEHTVEHTEVFDDNLLPDASEIEKLAQMDPLIIEWLKDRAAKEQDYRHSFSSRQLEIGNNHSRRDHNTTRCALFIYFSLVAGCIIFSYFLIRDGKDLQGTIFGGTAAVLAFAVLLTRKPQPKEDLKK
jgi:uncharacterized membrane protein